MKKQQKPNGRTPNHPRRNPLKSTIALLLALSLGGAMTNIVGRTMAFALAMTLGGAMTNGRAADADALPGLGVQPVEYFYTGKPYDADSESYTFKYRNYDPEVNRWTSADPSGFPDGPNNFCYVASPTNQYDDMGLTTKTYNGLFLASDAGHSFTVTFDFSITYTPDSAPSVSDKRLAGDTAGSTGNTNWTFKDLNVTLDDISLLTNEGITDGPNRYWDFGVHVFATLEVTKQSNFIDSITLYGFAVNTQSATTSSNSYNDTLHKQTDYFE